jgi:hypothetical protein
MPAKAKQQLLTALHQRATQLPKGLPQQLPIPLTATCWASSAWQDLPGGAGGAADAHAYNKPRGQAAAAATAVQAFDLLIADSTLHEGGLCSTAAAPCWLLHASNALSLPCYGSVTLSDVPACYATCAYCLLLTAASHCLCHVIANADRLFWMLEDSEAPCSQQLAQQAQQQEAAAALRHLLAAAVACQPPVLSAGAQEFLGKLMIWNLAAHAISA